MRRATVTFVMSVCPSDCNNSAPSGRVFKKKNLIFEDLSKICRGDSGSFRICQAIKALYVKTCGHLWQYLAEFFVGWEMLQGKHIVQKSNPFKNLFFSRLSCRLWDNADNMAHARSVLNSQGNKQTLRLCKHYCVPTTTMAAQTHLTDTLYVHLLSC